MRSNGKYFDTYQELSEHLWEDEEDWDDEDEEDWDEEEDWDDDDEEDDDEIPDDPDKKKIKFLIGTRFPNSSKIYDYLSDCTVLKKGDILTTQRKTITGQDSGIISVEFVGYKKYTKKGIPYKFLVISDVYTPSKTKKSVLPKKKPIDWREQRQNKYIKKEKESMKAKKAINVAKDSALETKDIAVKMVKGQAIITAIKTTLMEMDTIPDSVKGFLTIPGYSDLAIGFMLNMAGQTFTDSEVIEDAASATHFVGSVEFAKQFTVIQDLIENTIKSAMSGKIALAEKKTKDSKTDEEIID